MPTFLKVDEEFVRAHPCPECGGEPRELEGRVVEEFRFAPRDSDGRPMPYASYDDPGGTTGGVKWRTTLTCVNGHVTATDELKWFKDAQPGPPVMPSKRTVA